MTQQRVIHVSNRVDIPKPGQATAGGLDEAIAHPPQNCKMTRIGWSGHTLTGRAQVSDEDARHIITVNNTEYVTIDLTNNDLNGFYNGAANGFRWPLFHFRTDIARDGYSDSNNKISVEVNRHFAQEVIAQARPGDAIIIHDYHLIEMGLEMRKMGYEGPVGFFLHIPAPSADLLEELEARDQQRYVYGLMEKLFAYDFVGVQAKRDYKNLMTILHPQASFDAPDFFETVAIPPVRKLAGLASTFRHTQFGVFPVIGDTQSYIEKASKWSQRGEIEDLMDRLGLTEGMIDIVSLDRLDYSKGIPNKFSAIGLCLKNQNGSHENLHFLQVAPFGREGVMAYQREQASVEMAHNMLTTLFGNVATLHQEKVQREIMLVLFRKSNIGLVTPLRDGMNLVAFEYIAAQDPADPGVLVLSQFAGAADRLKHAAILVDPRQPEDIARGIMEARNLTREQRQELHRNGLEIAMSRSNQDWQSSLINETLSAAALRQRTDNLALNPL